MNHVTAWLEAYYDGELEPHRASRVEAHLATCEACRTELAAIETLSSLLRTTPKAPTLTPEGPFVAQVALQLPRRPADPPGKRVLRAGWMAVPAMLLALWAFVQATTLVAAGVTTVMSTELGRATFGPIINVERGGGWLAEVLTMLGSDISSTLLNALPLNAIAQWGILSIGLPLFIILLIASWLATWRAYHRHTQQRNQVGPNTLS